jgi:glycine oxidase
MRVEPSPGPECVLVGGGLIGLTLARELLRLGRSVLVLERARPGLGATGAAAGMLAPISEAQVAEDCLVRFGLDSLERYPQFVEEIERETGIDCGLSTAGTLWVAVTRDDHEELAHLERTLRLRDLPCRMLRAEELAALEPHLSGRALSALQVEQDLQLEQRRLTEGLVQVVESLGGRIVCGAMVQEIARCDDGLAVRGRTSRGESLEIVAPQVVLAPGAWNEAELRTPVDGWGVRPIKGQLLRLRGPRLLTHVVRTPHLYLVPRADGQLLVGATMEEMGFDDRPTAGASMDLLRHAWEVLPGIYDLELVEHCVGLRSATEDHLPLLGPTEVPGLWLAAGHYRHGVLLAPATGVHLARQMVDGECPELLRPFQPARLRKGSTEGETDVRGKRAWKPV